MTEPAKRTGEVIISAAFPQLFVADISRACAWFAATLGFETVFTYGEPPFYGQVKRDGARLNLRSIDRPVFDGDLREREQLLSAYLPVEHVEQLFVEFERQGAGFHSTLKQQPWGTRDFVVRDPDGNLLCFASDGA